MADEITNLTSPITATRIGGRSYDDWLEYRQSGDYPDCPENHFGTVQLDPITAYVRGLRCQVRLTGPTRDQLIREVSWREIDREGLDGLPGTRIMAVGYVACYHWVKQHVVASPLRAYWLQFLAWHSYPAPQEQMWRELAAEQLAVQQAKADAELAVEVTERQAAARLEEQRLATLAANEPLKLFSSGKIKRTARLFGGD